MHASFDADGFLIARAVVAADKLATLIDAFDAEFGGSGSSRSRRNVLALSPVRQLAESDALVRLVAANIGGDARPVRGILFDKAAGANWGVGWHQDQVIAVAERVETRGFTAWSDKEGVPHVKPPAGVLERMATVRLHLDDCPAENGPLEVLPGSHRHGLLTSDQIEERRQKTPPVTCTATAGDTLLMRPLLLHASAKASKPGRRRVLHLEYASDDLPGALRWPRW